MNSIRKLFGFLSILLVITSCGLQDAINKTSQTTDQMNQGLAQSNVTQAELLAEMQQLVTLTQSIDNSSNQINQSSSAFGKSAEALHLQILSGATQGLLDPNNTQNLNPPTEMLPYGLAYVNEATPDEIIAFADLLIKDGKFSSASIGSRKISLTAAGILGGLSSVAKFSQILSEEIDNQGVYQESTYNLAMLRYIFIRDALFLPNIQKSTVFNKSLLAATLSDYGALKQIVTLPYVSQINLVIPNLFVNYSINPSELSSLASQAVTAFQNGMSQKDLADPQVQQMLAQFN